MASTVSIDTKILEAILSRLDKLAEDVSTLKKSLHSPSYGIDSWWEKEIKEGEEDIKKGNYYELRDKKELKDFFKNIRSNTLNEKYHNKVQR